MKKTIFVVTHKNYHFPENSIYHAIKVGNGEMSGDLDYFKDNEGDNIAHLNSAFCELTALYWIWKNDNSDIVGLVHYRRYFKPEKQSILLNNKRIAASNDFESTLDKRTIIVSKPRNYVITNIEQHYKKAHLASDFDLLRAEVEAQYPEYMPAFEQVMNGNKVSLYNMFVAHREIMESYCEWLFSILFALEKKILYQDYDAYQKRVFGFMAERLFNVWLAHHHHELKVEYRPVINIEGENLIKKAYGMIKRHFFRG